MGVLCFGLPICVDASDPSSATTDGLFEKRMERLALLDEFSDALTI